MTHSQKHIYNKNNESRHYWKRWDLLFVVFTIYLSSITLHVEGNNKTPSPGGEGRGEVFFLEKCRECFDREDYDSALFYINKATITKGKIQQDPELAADIHEQYSLIFSALNDKQQSDYHRNMYLDIKEQARRDHHLEKEAEKLQDKAETQGMKIAVTFGVISIILIIAFYFSYKLSRRDDTDEKILSKKTYDEMAEELSEQMAILKHSISTNKEQNADKRTKVFLINTITPLIERMRHEMGKYIEDRKGERIEYIREILAQIQEYNNMLTEWIRLEQGRLAFKVETFQLEELFSLVRKNKKTFAMKGVELEVQDLSENPESQKPSPSPTTNKQPANSSPFLVKADKALTLFMINTLADNARKATAEGGKVSISACSTDEYVEISISDNGKGMSEEELSKVFSHTIENGHGFGLQNCRGIINSYKKAGSLFNCCMIDAESTQGKGSRFFFRLAKSLCLLALLAFCATASAQDKPSRYNEEIKDPHLRQAANFADSAYYSNMEGNYAQTIHYADSVQLYLTDHIVHCDKVDSLLMGDILVDICNEAAVASLALKRWEDYHTYNNTYEQYFDFMTNSNALEEKCQELENEIQTLLWIKWICNVFAVIVFILTAMMVANKYLKRKKLMKHVDELNITEMKNTVARLAYENDALHITNNILANGLSTIKHETLYFPSRISQQLSTVEDGALANPADALEQINFYLELHTRLSQIFQQPNLAPGIRVESTSLQRICGDDISVRADKDLLDYMLRLLKKQLKAKALDISVESRQPYVDLIIHTDTPLPANPTEAFAPRMENTTYMVCRQIIRDFSLQNNSRSCGITIDSSRKAIIIKLHQA